MKKYLLAVTAVITISGAAFALSAFNGDGLFGHHSLEAANLSNPHITEITTERVQNAFDEMDCYRPCDGLKLYQAHLSFTYMPDGSDLVITHTSSEDTSLEVQFGGRGGSFAYDDDSGEGHNPQVILSKPVSGRYEIYVQYPSDSHYAASIITVGIQPTSSSVEMLSGVINPEAEPTYEHLQISSGTENNGAFISATAGGSIDTSSIQDGCGGFVASAPDVTMDYTASDNFNLSIGTSSTYETSVLVQTPNGNWYCAGIFVESDLSEITFDTPQSGLYKIWSGTGGANFFRDVNIVINEREK